MRLPALFLMIFCLASSSSGTTSTPSAKDPASQSPRQPLRLVKTISLPSVQGRIDHMALDAAGQRLFVAARENDTLEVVDLKNGTVTSVSGFHKPQGVAYIPERETVVITNGGDGTTVFLSASSLKPVHVAKFSADADNVRYDAVTKYVYVGYGEGGLGILDSEGTVVGDIPLGGHPESFQIDVRAGKIYVNIPSRQEIASVDGKGLRVAARWSVPIGGNYSMALDVSHRRLFISTVTLPRLLVYDLDTGNMIAYLHTCQDVDDLYYDEPRRLIFASCGEGKINIARQLDADRYTTVANVPTAAGARTSLLHRKRGFCIWRLQHAKNLLRSRYMRWHGRDRHLEKRATSSAEKRSLVLIKEGSLRAANSPSPSHTINTAHRLQNSH